MKLGPGTQGACWYQKGLERRTYSKSNILLHDCTLACYFQVHLRYILNVGKTPTMMNIHITELIQNCMATLDTFVLHIELRERIKKQQILMKDSILSATSQAAVHNLSPPPPTPNFKSMYLGLKK